jgi:hypothetical protein
MRPVQETDQGVRVSGGIDGGLTKPNARIFATLGISLVLRAQHGANDCNPSNGAKVKTELDLRMEAPTEELGRMGNGDTGYGRIAIPPSIS